LNGLNSEKMCSITLLLIGSLIGVAAGQAELVCPPFFTEVGGKCYFVSPDAANAGHRAALYCQVQGGALARVSSFGEIVQLRQSSVLGTRTYFINSNITGFAFDMEYIRTTFSRTVRPSKFGPQDVDIANHCVVIDGAATLHDRPSLRWDIADCNSKYPVLCEANKTAPAHPPALPTLKAAGLEDSSAAAATTPLTCPSQFTGVGESCYLVSREPERASHCQVKGAILAAIQSREQLELLARTFLTKPVLVHRSRRSAECMVVDVAQNKWSVVDCQSQQYVLCETAPVRAEPSRRG